jgi:hypothetical protein
MVLTVEQRRLLDAAVQKARAAAEVAAGDAVRALAVDDTHRPSFLSDQQNELRLALRAKARQLGDDDRTRGAALPLLVRDVAYEQWHRLLFARFLERNGLLMHPDFPDTPLSLQDCEELARDEGEPDGWSLAARFAAQILPGVFRLDDPAVRVRLSVEHRLHLEQLLMAIPAEVFAAEDALGWVYQFWQTAEKKRVNEAGDKIGGADLSPVTQLFTENYMVRFLLENSLGAWWAGRHPGSPLVAQWAYLRRLDDGTPAAGTFSEWPTRAAEVTVMDPCCGSGHFLVAIFGMLWRMRAEEEGLSDAEAQDAVLRENLFGLELDPRCTQIATFNVALEAWKQGGYRQLPTPRIACSGVPVRQSREEWLEDVPEQLHEAMGRLHAQFRNADTLGSLIDPRPAQGGADQLFGRDLAIGVSWEQLRGHLAVKFAQEGSAGSVLGHATEDVVHAARMLAERYTLVATNPPFLSARRTGSILQKQLDVHFGPGSRDLSTALLVRAASLANTIALVSPHNWLYLKTLQAMRDWVNENFAIRVLAWLGPSAFSSISGEIVNVVLGVFQLGRLGSYQSINVADESWLNKQTGLSGAPLVTLEPVYGSRGVASIPLVGHSSGTKLSETGKAFTGLQTGDDLQFRIRFWEIPTIHGGWRLEVASDFNRGEFGGRYSAVRWPSDDFYKTRPSAHLHATAAEQSPSVLVRLMGSLPATLYDGDVWHQNCARFVPNQPDDLPAVWAFMSSSEFEGAVREIDHSIKVTPASIGRVAFDRERWQKVAEKVGPLPMPHSDDPTQWLFKGDVTTSTQPLQVAMARLLGYRWPKHEPGELDQLVDADGIVTLANLGEGDAASRLRELLAAAYGDRWTTALEHTLVAQADGKTGRLEDWLRDTFFAHHCKVFDNRPFLWHVWDGRKDGFSAVLYYHRLDRRTLEKLTYTSLGAWIRRQAQEVPAGMAGAEARLAAAEELKRQLEAIIEGEAPHDVYVRWKPMREQPIGWAPDLDDGVRLNIRPFVTAGILRSKVKIHWDKDRGKNPDGTDRINDLHPTLAERRNAREAGGA